MNEPADSAAQLDRLIEAVGGGSAATAEALGAAYQAELAKDPTRRKRAAVFYTPPQLVDFVLDIALEPMLADAGAAEILDLEIVDPACGSGVFLTRALDRVEAALISRGRVGGAALRREIASRCLRGVDVDPVAVGLCRAAIAAATEGGAADVRVGDSLLEDHAACDLVVTNPPWGQKEVRFSDEVKEALRLRFATARGVLDPFKLFVELAIDMVRPGGRFAMVLPDIVLLKNHEPTRRLLLANTIDWIAHAGRVFAGVNLDACVIAGRVGEAPTDHQVRTATSVPASAGGFRQQSVFAGLDSAKLNIFASDADLERVRALEHLPRVRDRFEVHEGVHSGNRRDALFRQAPTATSAPLVVGGSEISPFSLRWNGRYLDLDPAAIGRDQGGYANLGQPRWHTVKKIVVRRTGDSMVVAFDRHGRYVSNNFFVVVPRQPMSNDEQRAVVALLGSAWMTWYFRTVQPRVGRLFAELKIVHLSDFPLPELTSVEVATLSGLVTELESASESARGQLRQVLDREVDAIYAKVSR